MKYSLQFSLISCRSTEEIFALFISIAFTVDALKDLTLSELQLVRILSEETLKLLFKVLSLIQEPEIVNADRNITQLGQQFQMSTSVIDELSVSLYVNSVSISVCKVVADAKHVT